MTARMIWIASGDQSYTCGHYGIHWTTFGYETWITGKKCLGRQLSISQAMQLAEDDRQASDLKAVMVKS